ncbi:glycoside hydrolase family 61 protein [Pseudohyphozyma bogoriensis]|nr:glycoside hydrolase family 61 protein [Pseudohyphozyma bogoriensis]
MSYPPRSDSYTPRSDGVYTPTPDYSYPPTIDSRRGNHRSVPSAQSSYFDNDGGDAGDQYLSTRSSADLYAKVATGDEGYNYNEHEYKAPPGRSAKRAAAGGGFWSRMSSKAKRLTIIGVIIAILVVAAAVAIPVAVETTNHNKSNAAAGASSGATGTTTSPKGIPTGTSGSQDWKDAAYGGDGSVIYPESGGSFVYNNTFGGYWVSIPFNDTAQPQADVPRLNETWNYDTNRINGVNLGGWLVCEPFITPALWEPYNQGPTVNFNATVIDEWTLSEALGSNLSTVMEDHYNTFITEQDFAEIAGAGLNWVRLPFGWWMIEVYDGEPFLANVAWTYFQKAIMWARKYGLRINLDFHAVPGSQNGYNHSGKQGTINLLNGVMGVANAQRTLNYIRTMTEFISQPEYKNVIPMFSILNEPYAATIGVDVLRHFYIEVYHTIRNITGIGEGNGPFITFHDGFVAQATNVSVGGWDGFLGGADRMAIDSHNYLCFTTPNNDSVNYDATKPCAYWAAKVNESSATFGVSVAGEWALAVNDCGKWLNNVGNGYRYNGTYYIPGNTTAPEFAGIGSCDPWNDYATFSNETKTSFQQVAQSHMDAFKHWFFWTWKTGYSNDLGMIGNPLWNYQLALQEGYMPKDPRSSKGECAVIVAADGVTMSTYIAPSLSPWMTGGEGAGTITATAQVSAYGAWPPVSLGTTPVSNLPTYTQTADVITLTATTPTSYPSGYSAVSTPGDGWENASDTALYYTPVAGCTYPNAWSGVEATIPATPCTGTATARRERRHPDLVAVPTAPPKARLS